MLSERQMLSDDDNAPIRRNCESNDFLARKLCVTFVRSRQSMQVDLTTPICSNKISPLEFIRKYPCF
uniref:Uncharacterized protein n=1 Tax=Arundo donax TaxID=35708 RepID=A0A0A9E2F2_ARUDO